MSASFYASPTIGATTTVAVFFHEIPHEVGDFALLVQSGFSKRAAMGSQFVTAVGAFLGTLIGIAVQEYGGPSTDEAVSLNGGLWGTSLVSIHLSRSHVCAGIWLTKLLDLGRYAATLYRRHVPLCRYSSRDP